MSAKTTGTIWDLAISVPWRMVLLAMVDHADHNGEHMRASQAFIAWKTGYSSRNVSRIIQDMLTKQLLVLTDESIGQENEYRFNLSAARLKPIFHGREPNKARATHDKMSGVKRATHDKMSGVKRATHDKMSPPHDMLSGDTHDMLAIDRDQYHIESQHDGDSDSSARAILRDCGMYNGSIRKILALGIDPPTLIASVQSLADSGWGPGAIFNELTDNPPTKGQPYEHPRRPDAPDQRGRHAATSQRARGTHNGTGGSDIKDPGWRERLIAQAEAGELP